MVKATLTGKRQTTTQALGAGIARWIMQAGCGVMLLIGGELVACEIVGILPSGQIAIHDEDRNPVELSACRIYRDTVRQIKSLIGLA